MPDSIGQLVFDESQFEKHNFGKNAFKVFHTDYIEIILLTINQLVRGHKGNLPQEPVEKSRKSPLSSL